MKLKLTCYELNTWINCSCHGLTAAGVGDYLFWWCSCSSKLMIHVNIAFQEVRLRLMMLLGSFCQCQDRISCLMADQKEGGRIYQCILFLDVTFTPKPMLFLFHVGSLDFFLSHILAEETWGIVYSGASSKPILLLNMLIYA